MPNDARHHLAFAYVVFRKCGVDACGLISGDESKNLRFVDNLYGVGVKLVFRVRNKRYQKIAAVVTSQGFFGSLYGVLIV